MKPAKLDVLVAFFSYGGNGALATSTPLIRSWWAKTYHGMYTDERIGRVMEIDVVDTPITMSRNRVVKEAMDGGYDVIAMIDSDNVPDLYIGVDALAKPFFESSFDFCYKRLMQGIPTVIAAPYCGPPPHPTKGGEENVYVFKWVNNESDIPFGGMRIIGYDRDQAAIMRGIHPAAALPTGVCMFTTNAFECMPPPYFAYEYTNPQQSEKASTEDVYATRNLSLAGAKKWGTNIVFCNWDAWAGHYKPKVVGRPIILPLDSVADVFVESVKRGFSSDDAIRHVGWDGEKTPFPPDVQKAYAEAALDGDELLSKLHVNPPKQPQVKPILADGVRYEADEGVVSTADREGLGKLLTELFGRFGSDSRKLVYVGTPDQATLATMASHGCVYCVYDATDFEMDIDDDSEGRNGWVALEDEQKVRFVPVTGDIAYQDFWETADADFVFMQSDEVTPELFQQCMAATKDSGMVVCSEAVPELPRLEPLTMDGTTLWAVPKLLYLESLEGNGKKTSMAGVKF
jgi:hypothetical protein